MGLRHKEGQRTVSKVCLILQSTAVGGMEAHARDLAIEYCQRGIEVTAVIPSSDIFDHLADSFHVGGAKIVRLNTDARDGRFAQLGQWVRLVQLLRGFKPDAVHLHTGGTTGGLAVGIASRLASSATMVVTEHDLPIPLHPSLKYKLPKWIMDTTCHAVVSVSRFEASIRRERIGGSTKRMVTVLNGVPLPVIAPGEIETNRQNVRRELSLKDTDVVVGSIVRLSEGKGLDTLISSFALVRKNVACKLLLVGDGPLREKLEKLTRDLGMTDDVIFAGNRQDPMPYFDTLDLFVLAVPIGSMSIALLESMVRGVPSLITFGGPEEAIVDRVTGLTAPPNDVEGLAAVIQEAVLDPQLRQKLGQAGAEYVRKNFSVARVADDLLMIYASAWSGHVPSKYRSFSSPTLETTRRTA